MPLVLLSPAARSSRTARHPYLLAVAGQYGGRTILPLAPGLLHAAITAVDARAVTLGVRL